MGRFSALYDIERRPAWIRRDMYDKVSIKLLRQNRREFSDLVQWMFEDWLERKG